MPVDGVTGRLEVLPYVNLANSLDAERRTYEI